MDDQSALFDDEVAPSFYLRDEPKTAPETAPTPVTPARAPAVSAPAQDDDPFADEDVPAFYKRAATPAAAPASKDEPWAFTRGLYQGGVKQNLQALQDAAEMASVLGDSKAAQSLSDTVKKYKEGLDAGGKDMSLKVPSYSDIHGIGDVGTYIAEQLGSGIGSSGPSMTAGLATGILTSEAGPLVAAGTGLAAAGAVSYLQNAPAVYRELLDAGMTDKKAAAQWAMGAGVPIAALDTIGEKIPLLRGLGIDAADMVKKTIIKRIAETAAKSAGMEGITETAQQIVTDATAKLAADKPFGSKKELKGWLDNFLGGAIGGAGMGAVTGTFPSRTPAVEQGEPLEGEADKGTADTAPAHGGGIGAVGNPTGPGNAGGAQDQPPPADKGVVEGKPAAGPVTTTDPNGISPTEKSVLNPEPEPEAVEGDEEEVGEAGAEGTPILDETSRAAFDALTAGEPQEEAEPVPTGTPVPAAPETLGSPVSGARKAIARGRDEVNAVVDNVLAAVKPPTQIGTDTAADIAAQPEAALGQAAAPAVQPVPVAAAPELQPEPAPVEAAPNALPEEAPPADALQPEPVPPAAAPTPDAVLAPEDNTGDGFEMDLTPDDELFADELPSPTKGEIAKETSAERSKSGTEEEQKETPVAPAERAPVEEVAQRATPKPPLKLKKRREVVVNPTAKAAPEKTEHVTKPNLEGRPRSEAVKNMLHAEVREAIRTKLAGDYTKDVGDAAAEQAFKEHADEADSSQHDSIGAATTKLRGPIIERAKALAVEKAAQARKDEAEGKAKDVLAGVKKAKEIAELRLREGTGQEKERTGSDKGKTAAGLAKESPRSWERRYEESTSEDERTQAIKKLLRNRGLMHRGNQKDPVRLAARQNITAKLEAFREEDRQAALEQAAKDEAAKPKVDEKAEVEKQAKAYEQTDEEREQAEKTARNKARAAQHVEHNKKFDAVVEAHPEPDYRKMRTMAEMNAATPSHVMAFFNDLRARIGAIPDSLDPRQSKAQNYLVAAKRLLGKADSQGRYKTPRGDRLSDLVLLEGMAKSETPEEFYSQLDKMDGDMRQAAAGYEADEQEDIKEKEGAYTGRGLTETDEAEGTLREEGDLSEEDQSELAAWRMSQSTDRGTSSTQSSAPQAASTSSTGIRTTRGEVSVAKEDVQSVSDVLELSAHPPSGGMKPMRSVWRFIGKRGRALTGDISGMPSNREEGLPWLQEQTQARDTRSIYNVLRKMTDKQIRQRLADVPVYWVSDDQMRTLLGTEGKPNNTTNAFWLEPTQAARADGGKGAIVMNKALRGKPEMQAYVIRHEAIHGLTVYANDENIDGTRDIMQSMLNELRAQLRGMGKEHVYDDPTHAEFQYGTANVHEFITEAFSNPAFQEFLANTELPSNVLRKLGDHKLTSRGTMTWWDLFLNTIQKVMKLSGFGLRGKSYLDGILQLGEPSMRNENFFQQHAIQGFLNDSARAMKPRSSAQIRLPGGQWSLPGSEHLKAHETEYSDDMIANVTTNTYETIANFADLPGAGDRFRSTWNKWKTITQLAQDTVPILGREKNPLFRIVDAVRKQGVVAKQLMQTGDKLAVRMSKLVKGAREEFAEIVNGATLHNVDPTVPLTDPNNKHIYEKGPSHAIKRANHAKLAARYNALPKEARELFKETGKFYRDMQNEMTRQQVATMLGEAREADSLPPLPAGMTDKQLEDWIVGGGIDKIGRVAETPADRDKHAALGALAPSFKNAVTLRVTKGFYSPLMRRGQYIVRARRRLVVPPGAQVFGPNRDQLLFRSEKDYLAWAAKEEDHQRATPKIIRLKIINGTLTQITEPEATKKNEFWLASPQLDHFERFDNKREADAVSKAMRADPAYHQVTSPDLGRDFRNSSAEFNILPDAQKKLIEDTTKHLDGPIKEHVRRQLANSIMQMNVGTRIQQRQRKRRGVHGYDQDVARAMADYNVSASNQIANLRARPEINAGRRETEREIEQRKFVTDGSNLTLSHNLKAINDNLKVNEEYDPSTPGARFVQNMLAISFIKHLFSPANWIINAFQTGMVAAPYLMSRYGVGAALKLANAYRLIGSTHGGRIKANLIAKGKHGEAAAIQHLIDVGLLDEEAGMELEASKIRQGAIERAISPIATLASKIPSRIEGVNRATTGIAAYQSALGAGKTHEQAVLAAEDAVNDTQGDYASAVAPTKFKKSLLAKFVLQFKKYSQMMTRILARDVRILFKKMPGESRKQAVKEIMLLSATHGMMAGAAGLPFMEAFKILAIIANGLGIDDDDWDDWTNWGQNYLKGFMGDTLSEAMVRGAPRMLGVDVSSRMGLDSLLTFGTPKSVKGVPQTKDWLLSNLIGAPADVVVQTMQGIGDFTKAIQEGSWADFGKGVSKMALPKVGLDIWKAADGLAGNKKKESGIEIPGTQLNYGEAMWRALGFSSGRQQLRYETGTGYENKQHQKVMANRQTMMQSWLNGDKGERTERWTAIREWNKQHKDAKERITLEGLYQADAKRKKEMRKAVAQEAEQ